MTARLFESTLCAVALFASCAASAASPAQSLGIKLQDSSDPAIAHMKIVIDHDVLKPGRVTFEAENQSKTLVHEVLIARDVGAGELPFNAKANRVIESRVRRLGEISDLAPGKSGKLSLNLKAGKY